MISENLENIRKNIVIAGGHNVKVIAATKYADAMQMKEAIMAGVDAIGENRVQDAVAKFPGLPNAEKHMIGHLQTNKVREAVRLFDCIQSVDSYKLAKEINRRTEKKMCVLIQVNISREPQKFGISLEEAHGFYDKISRLENLDIAGLMGIAPAGQDPRPYFRMLKKIYDTIGLRYLSMGMSSDYEIAVQEGSNMVRVGSKLFQ